MIETYIETRPTGLRAFRCFQSDFQFLAVLWPMSVHLGVTKFLQSSQVAFFFGPCLALVNCTSGAPSTGPWQVALPAGCPKIPWFIVIFHDFSFFFPHWALCGSGGCWMMLAPPGRSPRSKMTGKHRKTILKMVRLKIVRFPLDVIKASTNKLTSSSGTCSWK